MAFFANLFRSLLKNDKEDFIEFCQRVGNERILNEYLDSFDVTSSLISLPFFFSFSPFSLSYFPFLPSLGDLFEFNGKTPNFVKLFPPIFDVYLQTKDEFPFPKTSKGVLHDLFDAQVEKEGEGGRGIWKIERNSDFELRYIFIFFSHFFFLIFSPQLYLFSPSREHSKETKKTKKSKLQHF